MEEIENDKRQLVTIRQVMAIRSYTVLGLYSQHYYYYLRMGPISWSVCYCRALKPSVNVTLKLIGPIHKLGRKLSLVNAVIGLLKITFM